MMMAMTAVVPALVMAAAAMPAVMMTASSVESVAVTAAMLDLDQRVVLRGHRGDTDSGRR